ncbi:MAG: membrane protein insertion efficiency factor YidD [Planctomycetes bacterium B3_Pla]|nr:MAG: membrane protein insertion efficiency factor YidD [Planctomycetes bacterium B3_Pla]
MKCLAIQMIVLYQKHLRRYHNRQCIYIPSCSDYMIQAIRKYGVLKGIYYGYQRIKRCNGALYKGGDDYP